MINILIDFFYKKILPDDEDIKKMIDWKLRAIKQIEDHYNEIFNPKIDLIYFVKHYDEIYRMITPEGEILPDLLNDITYYTKDGRNARYKLLLPKLDNNIEESRLHKRIEQKENRKKALDESIYSYYNCLLREVMDFVEKYPQWKDLLKYGE